MSAEILRQVGRLRRAWPILAGELAHARPARRSGAPTATPERLAYLDEQARLDRGARFDAVRTNAKPSGPIHDGIPAGVLVARAVVDQVVTDCAGEAYAAADAGEQLARAADTDGRVYAALTVLTACARLGLPAELAAELADRLDEAAALAELTAGLDAQRVKVPAQPCPVCWLYSLWVATSPHADEWVAMCDYRRCVCTGKGCPCGRPDRVAGRRHIWSRDEWARLNTVINIFLTRVVTNAV